MKGHKFAVAVGAMLVVGALTAALAEKKEAGGTKYTQTTGLITAVDAAAKTITVKGAKAEKTLSITDKTTLHVLTMAALADLAKGQQVRVMGKVSKDKLSVEAAKIVILSADAQLRGTGRAKDQITGTIEETGDKLSIKSLDGKTVSATTSDATRVAKQGEGKFEDLKVGGNVFTRAAVEGDTLRATTVFVRPAEFAARAKSGGKKKDK